MTDNIKKLLLGYFQGDERKVELWMKSPNPLLGGISPDAMIKIGREARLLQFVQTQLRGEW